MPTPKHSTPRLATFTVGAATLGAVAMSTFMSNFRREGAVLVPGAFVHVGTPENIYAGGKIDRVFFMSDGSHNIRLDCEESYVPGKQWGSPCQESFE